ncbi:MAG: methionyl-tRNA formyltransferase [Arcobacteraceae bacterium]|jgi:methionyl-tRNA formyltransferase
MSKKIIFMGTPDYATIILKELIENRFQIEAVFTQPDKKVGRNQVITMPHIKQFILDNNFEFPIYQPITLRDDGVFEILNSIKPDFIIVAAYGQILPQNILNIAPCINLHASLLPKYRGASPIQQSILNNDKFSGVTAMMMESGLDTGDIIGLKYMEIDKHTTVDELFNHLSEIAASLTIEVLKVFSSIKPKKQNTNQASHCRKIIKEDGLTLFDDAMRFYQQYKAYKSWPGVYLGSGLKIKECSLNDSDTTNESGQILEINKDHIIVGCKKGSLVVFEVQAPSKKSLSVLDYVRGARLNVGNFLI